MDRPCVAFALCTRGPSDSGPELAHAEFLLPGVDGKTHSLSDYASQPVLAVVFTGNHCPIAQMYEQRIEQLYQTYGKKGVAVVVIMGNDRRQSGLMNSIPPT